MERPSKSVRFGHSMPKPLRLPPIDHDRSIRRPIWLDDRQMTYEVEQKHRVTDKPALIARLRERGCSLEEPIQQSDQYFAHPCRDFAATDEALRIRVVGDESFVTYKGPKL